MTQSTSSKYKMPWTIFILILLLTNVIEGTVIRGEKANAICQATNSDLEQYLVEVNNPYDCTKYFSCQRIGHTGFLAHLLQCPKGTSFLPRFLKGSCNGPDPKDVLDCFKDLDQGPMWSDWSAWSTCSSSCGDQATKQRSRLCISELLEGQRQQCIGDDHETDTCLDLPSCRGSRKLSSGPGDWSDWSLWSACSASCGDQATKQRSRLCISEPCNGDDIEIGTCLDLPMCSSPWSTWSACSKTCGHASRHRSRQDEMEVDTCPDLPKCQGNLQILVLISHADG